MKGNTMLFLLLILFCGIGLTAQTTYIMGSDTFSSDCEGTLLDNVGDYAANDTSIFTICTDAADGECLTIRFTDFFTEALDFNSAGVQLSSGDYLNVYNGAGTSSPLIDTYAGFLADSGVGIFGEITTDGGCLTFEFVTNGDVEYSGWTANWFCSFDSTCSVRTDMAPNNDCENAFLICEDNVFNFNINNSGAEVDLTSTNDGCLSGEHQSSWYIFAIDNNAPAGTSLGFTINPENPSDYDFAVYGPSIGCGELDVPLRCSWAAGNGETGLDSNSVDVSEGAGGDSFVAPLIVNPGEKYLLIVDNWSSNDQGFELTWNGDAKDYLVCSFCDVEVDAGEDFSVCQNEPISLSATATNLEAIAAYNYNWTSNEEGFVFDDSSLAEPTITPPTDYLGEVTFVLVGGNPNDTTCTSIDEITIMIDEEIPDSLVVTCESVNNTSVTYNWDTIVGVTSYEIAYIIVPEGITGFFTITNTTITINELNPNSFVDMSICPIVEEGYCAVACLGNVLCEPIPVGIADNGNAQSMTMDVQVYPNPMDNQTQGNLTIKWANTNQQASQVRLINTTGSVVQTKYLSQSETEQISWIIPDLPKGLYFVEVYFQEKIAIRKIIIQ